MYDFNKSFDNDPCHHLIIYDIKRNTLMSGMITLLDGCMYYHTLIPQNRCPNKNIPDSEKSNKTRVNTTFVSTPDKHFRLYDLPLLARPRVISGIVNLHQRPVLSFFLQFLVHFLPFISLFSYFRRRHRRVLSVASRASVPNGKIVRIGHG